MRPQSSLGLAGLAEVAVEAYMLSLYPNRANLSAVVRFLFVAGSL